MHRCQVIWLHHELLNGLKAGDLLSDVRSIEAIDAVGPHDATLAGLDLVNHSCGLLTIDSLRDQTERLTKEPTLGTIVRVNELINEVHHWLRVLVTLIVEIEELICDVVGTTLFYHVFVPVLEHDFVVILGTSD